MPSSELTYCGLAGPRNHEQGIVPPTPAQGERGDCEAVGEGALAAELNAALRSGPRRFEVQDFARIGDTWKQGVRFRIAEVSPYEKSGPSWLGTRRRLVVRRCTLRRQPCPARSDFRRRPSRTPISRAPSAGKRLSPRSGIGAFTPAQQRSTPSYVGAKIRLTGLRAYFPASRMGRST